MIVQNASDANKSSTALLGGKSKEEIGAALGSRLGPKAGPARLEPLDADDAAGPSSIAAFNGAGPSDESSEVTQPFPPTYPT